MRLVGAAGANVVIDRKGQRRGKWAPLFGALEDHFFVTGIVQPQPPRSARIAALRRKLNLGEKDTRRFYRWTREVGRALDSYDRQCDLIFQLQTLFACGTDFEQRQYVIYADSTLALTLRHYPQGWARDATDNSTFLDLEAKVARSAMVVCTSSEWARASMIKDYGCDPRRVFAVGGGAIPVATTSQHRENRVALFVGMDFDRKGGRVLLEAWTLVHQQLTDAELWIAGPRVNMNTQAGIKWLGRLDAKELEEVRNRAAIFVMPSLFEPWGFVLNEAMASGLPCIGTNICAMPEIIHHGTTGLLVDPNDPRQLADALLELLNDPAKARRMGKAGLASYLVEGTWASAAANIANAIERAQACEP